MRRDKHSGNAQKLFLGFIRISDEAAYHHTGRAGNFGEQPGDQAAGAAFGGDDADIFGARRAQQVPRPIQQRGVEHHTTRKYCRAPAITAAARPATMSSAITPNPPGSFSAAEIGQGFKMSNRRNSRNARANSVTLG